MQRLSFHVGVEAKDAKSATPPFHVKHSPPSFLPPALAAGGFLLKNSMHLQGKNRKTS